MAKEKIKDFFSVSATQKRGYFLLAIIFLLILFAPKIYKAFIFDTETIDFEKDRTVIEAFISSLQFQNSNQYGSEDRGKYKMNLDFPESSAAKSKLYPFPFNPNNLPVEQWIEMGFTQKQVQSIKKYEQKGGRFYTKKDVKKLWAISPEEYNIIEPFIQLPDTLSERQYYRNTPKEEKTYQIVELNSADTTMLKTLPGIGSSFARKIYNYKFKLGGFHSKFQLLEIKDMDSSRFAGIESYIDVNPWLIRKIDINTADFDKLSSHPYINNNIAISIINYRNRHGKYNTTEDIMKSELIDLNLYTKLAPYLTTE